jgi:hypothetical protein
MRHLLQAWVATLETFALEVIYGRRRAPFLRFTLFLLSKVFNLLVKIRRRLGIQPRRNRTHPHDFP